MKKAKLKERRNIKPFAFANGDIVVGLPGSYVSPSVRFRVVKRVHSQRFGKHPINVYDIVSVATDDICKFQRVYEDKIIIDGVEGLLKKHDLGTNSHIRARATA